MRPLVLALNPSVDVEWRVRGVRWGIRPRTIPTPTRDTPMTKPVVRTFVLWDEPLDRLSVCFLFGG